MNEYARIKRLIVALGLSGILNVFLIAFVIHSIMVERPPTPYCELKPVINNPAVVSRGNAQVIRELRKYSYEELLLQLSNKQLVDNGYCQRDLALACLIAYHYLDLRRALGSEVDELQTRQVAFGKRHDGSL